MSKYPTISVNLVGENGNALAIVGRVAAALRRAGVDPARNRANSRPGRHRGDRRYGA